MEVIDREETFGWVTVRLHPSEWAQIQDLYALVTNRTLGERGSMDLKPVLKALGALDGLRRYLGQNMALIWSLVRSMA